MIVVIIATACGPKMSVIGANSLLKTDILDREVEMPDDYGDANTLNCVSCGHLGYHHRPECGYREGGFLHAGGEKCNCPRFVPPPM